MTDIDSFLAQYGTTGTSPAPSDAIVLLVELCAARQDDVAFLHLGLEFHVRPDDVISASPAPSTTLAPAGPACCLVLKRNTELWRKTRWLAAELTALPFVLARFVHRPSRIIDYQSLKWFADRGLIPKPDQTQP